MRCTFNVTNPSKYPVPDATKEYVSVFQPYIWSVSSSKVRDYQVRLYYEYLHCTGNGGRVFYYTLTYNDNSVPNYLGYPCFRYSDIRELVNGAFVKKLKRYYHCKFKYFIACESGEGKGKRGYGNNPHYHCIFFTYPDSDEYTPIPAKEFRTLVRLYWQGYDVDEHSKNPSPENFKFGIAKAGSRKGYKDEGLVSDFRALTYVCKYVVKDVDCFNEYSDSLSENNANSLRKFSRARLAGVKGAIYDSAVRLVSDSLEYKWLFVEQFRSDADYMHYSFRQFNDESLDTYDLSFVDWFISGNLDKFSRFIRPYVRDVYKEMLSKYFNEFGPKVRISNGVGLSALNHIQNEDEPTIPLPSKDGFKSVPIGRYLYRKLYYDVKKDPVNNNPYYTLNYKGIAVVCANLDRNLQRISDNFTNIISRVLSDSVLYDEICQYVRSNGRHYSEVCDLPSFSDFCDFFHSFPQADGLRFVSRRYALWKKIYEGRFFSATSIDSEFDWPDISPSEDYRYFLQDFHQINTYFPSGICVLHRTFSDLYLPYSYHPFFRSYMVLFRMCDIIFDYFDWCKSEKSRKDFLKRKEEIDFLYNKL